MFFSTFDPYMEKNEIIYNKKSLQYETDYYCFICYQIQKNNDTKIIQMNSITKYNKKCLCNLFIHISCLDMWFDINNDCPVCRKKMKLYISNKMNYKNFLYIVINCILYMTSAIYYYIMYIYLSIIILNMYNILKKN